MDRVTSAAARVTRGSGWTWPCAGAVTLAFAALILYLPSTSSISSGSSSSSKLHFLLSELLQQHAATGAEWAHVSLVATAGVVGACLVAATHAKGDCDCDNLKMDAYGTAETHLTLRAASVVTFTTTGLVRAPALSHAVQGAAAAAAAVAVTVVVAVAAAAAAAAAADFSSAALWWLLCISLLLLPPSLLWARLAMTEGVQAWHIPGKKYAFATIITCHALSPSPLSLTPHYPGDSQVYSLIRTVSAAASIVMACSPATARLRIA
jgi:hypothetical protein